MKQSLLGIFMKAVMQRLSTTMQLIEFFFYQNVLYLIHFIFCNFNSIEQVNRWPVYGEKIFISETSNRKKKNAWKRRQNDDLKVAIYDDVTFR